LGVATVVVVVVFVVVVVDVAAVSAVAAVGVRGTPWPHAWSRLPAAHTSSAEAYACVKFN
jgi:hypothetical protein